VSKDGHADQERPEPSVKNLRKDPASRRASSAASEDSPAIGSADSEGGLDITFDGFLLYRRIERERRKRGRHGTSLLRPYSRRGFARLLKQYALAPASFLRLESFVLSQPRPLRLDVPGCDVDLVDVVNGLAPRRSRERPRNVG
jgi:hypothetical protein